MREKFVIIGLMVCCALFGYGYSIAEHRAPVAARDAAPVAAFSFSDCKLKICSCDAESQGYDTEAHALAATAAAMVDARVNAGKPLDASEIKLITDTFTANAQRSKANRDAAKHVANVLAAPLLP